MRGPWPSRAGLINGVAPDARPCKDIAEAALKPQARGPSSWPTLPVKTSPSKS
jgi:hypothetical protein